MAQTTPGGAAPPVEEKPASISGDVRNSVTGAPIERAHVVFRLFQNGTWNRYGALTDASGKYSVGNIPPGEYSIVMDRTGFVVPAEVARAKVKVIADERKANYRLKLTPVGTISGTVTGSDGLPMEGIQVRTIQGGQWRQSGTTDDRGVYRIGGLAPGKYRVRAVVDQLPFPPEIRTDGTAEIHYGSTYYPDQVDEAAARRIEVGPAIDVTGIDIRLVQTPIVRVAGKISGQPEGTPHVGLMVTSGHNTNSTLVKPDGTFEIWRMDPGRYSFTASIGGGSSDAMRSAPLDVDVGQNDIENLELRLLKSEDIRGQIAFDDEMAKRPQPPPSQQTQQQSQIQAKQIAATRISLRDANRGFISNTVDVAEDGTFVLTKVQPGKYIVRPIGYPAYVKSVTVGKIESQGSELDLSYGTNGASVVVTLASTFGTVTGTVSDAKGPAAGARVLILDPLKRSQYSSTQTGDDGTFTFKRVAPGTYKLMALDDDSEIGVIQQAPNLDDYADQMETVEVSPIVTVTHDLKMPSVK
jgi:hypothetical protein